MISVIIPTYGRLDLVRECIEHINLNVCEKEIIVIDDGYGIDIENVVLIKNEENKGFGASINIGIRNAKSDIVVICNSDVFIKSTCLQELAFALNYADIAGAKLFYIDGTIQHAGVTYCGNYNFYHYFWHQKEGGDEPKYCPVTGALMAFRKEVIERIGYFDESFPMAYEDVDFCFRAIKAGLRVLYWPGAIAVHLEGATRGNDYESKMAKNPIAYEREKQSMEYFKTKYSESEIKELCICKPFQA
jgi:GT2 family glycosyltransferase